MEVRYLLCLTYMSLPLWDCSLLWCVLNNEAIVVQFNYRLTLICILYF